MKYEEAYKKIKTFLENDGTGELDGIVLESALNAIERQIPIKPEVYPLHKVTKYGSFLHLKCPICGKLIAATYEKCVEYGRGLPNDIKGCSGCLQAIDLTEYYQIGQSETEIQ